MKLDRLVSIITVLLRRPRVQAKELAELFDVSVRTILRDIDTINLSGIPIVTYQGAGGGIGIAEGFKLDKSVLTSDDMAALITGMQGVALSLGDPKLGILIDKLKNSIPKSQLNTVNLKTSQIVIDLSPWGGNRYLKDAINTLRKAIEEQHEVVFIYIDSDSRKTERIVQPYSLVLKGQNWYLYGWCRLRKAFRLFKIIRARELKALNTSFVRVEPEALAAAETENIEDARETAYLLLAFDLTAENTVLEWFGDGDIEHMDGKLIVKAALPENNWLYGFLLGFGPALEILEPQHIRVIVAEMALQVYRKYNR